MVATRRQAAKRLNEQQASFQGQTHVDDSQPDQHNALMEELGINTTERKPVSFICSLYRCMSLAWLRCNIRIGSFLLTPMEKLLYHSILILLIVLVLLGFVNSTWFYFHSIALWSHNLFQQGWRSTYQQFFLGMPSKNETT